jgi:ATP phosphoribosyltransferase
MQGFCSCTKSIWIQLHKRSGWVTNSYFYPNTVNEYFNSFGVTVDIHQISGSVEIAPNIGLADAIVDIVSSGSTLFKKQFKLKLRSYKKWSCISGFSKSDSWCSKLIDTLKFRIESVLRAVNQNIFWWTNEEDAMKNAQKKTPTTFFVTNP